MTENYRLVFDLASAPDRWKNVDLPLIILPVIGLILVITPQRIVDRVLPNGPRGIWGKAFGIVFFLFTATISIGTTYGHFKDVNSYRTLEKRGEMSFVEGCLEGFHPMRETGHEDERVKVNGDTFSYSDFDESTPAFNNTESHGGPIHADSAVRIWHAGNAIVKLEVRDHACPKAPDLPQAE